jgi:5-dehydro-2-deoxygluconokinase
MTAPAFDLVCMGRAAVDLYGEQLGCPLEEVSTFARYLGGSPANTAVGAARLGLRVAMITRVGDEQNGTFVRRTLAREGVDVSQVTTDPARLTALVFLAIRGPDDFPHIFYRDNCADMALEAGHIDPAFVAGCRALLVSGTHLARETTRRACERAADAMRGAGRRVVLDIDYRPVLWGLARPAEGAARFARSADATATIRAFLPRCALVVGTAEEFQVAGGSEDVIAALREVRAATGALLILKMGARGCIAFAGPIPASLEGGVTCEGFPVETFNVLGAGDAFMAGFLSGWLRDEPIAECCRRANACGAIVVSRHGCAPAMPGEAELRELLDHGAAATPRLREDAHFQYLHRAAARRPVDTPLHVLAFDHRAQLEALAQAHGGGPERIAEFKSLVAQAFVRVSQGRRGAGALVDDRYGSAVLPALTAAGTWIARPVEVPGTNPLQFEQGAHVGLAMRAWPASHVAKCLVHLRADDPTAHLEAQLATIRVLAEECAAGGRELLLEVIPPPRSGDDASTTARALQAIYDAGIRPDWWKLPPAPDALAWRELDAAIERNDPLCRGVLVLGMDSDAGGLRAGFRAAAKSPWVRGFAVGRSIFAGAAGKWFAGEWPDARAVDDIAARYEEVIRLWEEETA